MRLSRYFYFAETFLVAPIFRSTGTDSPVLSSPIDLMKVTNCQRCGSGSLDHTGIPRHTTPFVKSQKSVPGVAVCTGAFNRLGPLREPSPASP